MKIDDISMAHTIIIDLFCQVAIANITAKTTIKTAPARSETNWEKKQSKPKTAAMSHRA